MSLAWWLNTAWMLKCSAETHAFRRATRHVARTQEQVLARMLRDNEDTEFGRAHGFGRIRDPREYQRRVPPSRYEDYAGYLGRIAAGRQGVLTRDRVELLEPTSGTTSGEKLVPYTASLRRQFQRAVAAWVGDLFRHRPAIRVGRAYWSISPALGGPRRTAGGVLVGFEDDAAYLGGLERLALSRLLVAPPELARVADLEAFRYCTLLCLLRAEDLALISVWNPTFLTALLGSLGPWQDRLLADVRDGVARPPAPISDALARRIAGRPDPSRAERLREALTSRLSPGERLKAVWPRLALLSCWADAAAARYLPELRALFPPGVEVQPKGLVATEGCVSFPLVGRPAPVLAVRSHFFEFQEGDGAVFRLAHDLEAGGRYRVVLTTAGGLYRYQLRDEVEVAGFEGRCPLLRFLGKADRVSDLVGEKLAEPHVRDVLDRLFAAHGLTPRFALVAPTDSTPPRYRLYLQDETVRREPGLLGALAAGLEAGLAENPHYRYAVGLGQLGAAAVEVLTPGDEGVWGVYERRCLALGQRAGNVKPASLDPWTGWAGEFARPAQFQSSKGSEEAGRASDQSGPVGRPSGSFATTE